MTDLRDLIERMRAQLHVWEDCARFEEWTGFHREYADAFKLIQSLSERIDELEGLLVEQGICPKCSGTHLGSPGDCNGPPTPSRPHPHARDMIA